jgi:hypothetical protein
MLRIDYAEQKELSSASFQEGMGNEFGTSIAFRQLTSLRHFAKGNEHVIIVGWTRFALLHVDEQLPKGCLLADRL